MNLLDLMGDPNPASPPQPKPAPSPQAKPEPVGGFTPRPVRPMWRNGHPVPQSEVGYVPHSDGDMRWLTHGYAEGKPLGRWFRWHGKKEMWVCIDPADVTGINCHPDAPPAGSAML